MPTRKRKWISEDSVESGEPLCKKRKLIQNKCQSLEPKVLKKDPFQDTTIPVASPRRNKPYHRIPKRRRHSTYSAYPSNSNHNNHDQDNDDNTNIQDENENEDDDLDLNSDLSSESNLSITPNDYPSRINKLQLRSQPSTPIRSTPIKKFNTDSNREPLSQSAKKSQRVRRRTFISNHDRKQIPNLSSSQSIQFSPPLQTKSDKIHEKEEIHLQQQQQQNQYHSKPKLEKTHVIVGVNYSDYNDTDDNNDNINDYNGHKKQSFPSYNLYEIILFVLIGVILGFTVSLTVYHQNELNQKNESKYIQCQKCMKEQAILNDESNRLKEECLNKQNEIEICKKDKEELRSLMNTKIENNHNDNNDCNSLYKSKIDLLEHELGECNVEWGACQQLGRQKDALDKKRVEEIANQKRKFSLCNQQLKKYKTNI